MILFTDHSHHQLQRRARWWASSPHPHVCPPPPLPGPWSPAAGKPVRTPRPAPQPCQPEGGAPTKVSGSTLSKGSHTPLRGTRRLSSHGLPLIRPPVGEETGTRVRLEVTQDTPHSLLSWLRALHFKCRAQATFVLDFKT